MKTTLAQYISQRRGEMPSCPTARELQVIKLIAEGKCSKEIADELGVSLSTVVTHRSNINRRMGFHSIVEVVLYAVRNGIVQVDIPLLRPVPEKPKPAATLPKPAKEFAFTDSLSQ